MKPEYSSSDLMLALAILNGTATPKARPGAAVTGEAKAGDANREGQADYATTGGKTNGHGR